MSLTITNLQKKIDQQPVLEAVTFSLDRGQVVGLVGPNGIGKTTIFAPSPISILRMAER